MIQIDEVVLHRLTMPLQFRFETSFGVQTHRDILLAEIRTDEGLVGWGESVALSRPLYNEETTDSVYAFLVREGIPLLFSRQWADPAEFFPYAKTFHGNHMGKFTLEGPLWDIASQQRGVPLARLLGGAKTRVDVGVSIGIKPVQELLQEVKDYVDQGYRRIKIKVKPGWDSEPIGAIRALFPDVPLMVDANTAYTADDIETLKVLDEYNLMMIEQPFAEDAWDLYPIVQAALKTPICLDESIHTLEDAKRAIRSQACRIINVKLGRIGGIQAALDLVPVAEQAGIELWCGGMLETGIGRAFNVALATLSAFTLPGDTAASGRYWHPDIIRPEVTVDNGQIQVPDVAGLGYAVDTDQIQRYQWAQWHFRRGQDSPKFIS